MKPWSIHGLTKSELKNEPACCLTWLIHQLPRPRPLPNGVFAVTHRKIFGYIICIVVVINKTWPRALMKAIRDWCDTQLTTNIIEGQTHKSIRKYLYVCMYMYTSITIFFPTRIHTLPSPYPTHALLYTSQVPRGTSTLILSS